VAWLGNLTESLEIFDEDFIAVTVHPSETQDMIRKWFFIPEKVKEQYENYKYPGFLFYAGQIVANAKKFSYADFEDVLKSKEHPVCEREDIFVGADQGVLNYVVAKKIKNNSLSFRSHNFMILRWTPGMEKVSFSDVVEKKPKDFLVHWHGPKNGLISFLPNSQLLKFYETFYYSKIKNGRIKMYRRRMGRTFLHFRAFLYELFKKIYFSLLSPIRKTYTGRI
jgi:hypothetical protein